MKKQGELKCYECSLDRKHWTQLNATSPGDAKSQFLRYLDGGWHYTMILCHVLGRPHTSEEFKRNAKYRGIDFAYCGMVIDVNGKKGVITGHNDSANLNVLFTEGKYKGQTLNCHPNWETTYFNSKGEIIKTFKKSLTFDNLK